MSHFWRPAPLALSFAAILVMTTAGLPQAGNGRSGVQYFPQDHLSAAFAKSGAEHLNDGANYTVLAAHRDKPGEVELHTLDLDIVYVVHGEASLVTGGKMVGGKTTAPNEERGTSIVGGATYHLAKGDVIIVPKGTPHWFKEVPQQVSYFVVKVR